MALNIIRFGIPSLDRLLGRPESQQGAGADYGIALDGQSTTVCIVGTDGTGKSVLAFHLASRYIADSYHPQSASPTNACYISTDLGLPKAKAIWERYRLNHPNTRKNPLDNPAGWKYPVNSTKEIPLVGGRVSAQEEAGKSGEIFTGNPPGPQLTFFDLTAAPEGIGNLHAVVEKLSDTGDAPKHLLLIDAAERLEAVIGENTPCEGTTRRNPSEEAGRRARIAEILRITKGRCHVVFIVEESAVDERSPEESVSDVVIRLREVEVDGYQRRTIAIEKLRGQAYVRGQHSIRLRSGEGSKTIARPTLDDSPDDPSRLFNLDDPEVAVPTPEGGGDTENRPKYQKYVMVYPSLHARHRPWTKGGSEDFFSLQTEELAKFNVQYLDELLEHQSKPPLIGLRPGTVAALIGDPGTHKVHLTRSYLADTFSAVRALLAESEHPEQLFVPGDTRLAGAVQSSGSSVLITTTDTDAWQLALQLARLLLPSRGFASSIGAKETTFEAYTKPLANRILPSIVCRRLELHDLPAAILLNIVTSAVEFLPKKQGEGTRPNLAPVRLVLDDIRRWREIYADLRRESLFLPALLFNLRRANVTTLIVDSSLGQPETAARAQRETEARSLADIRLYTWRVPFYGESRVAIAAIPPLPVDPTATGPSPARRALVRELRTIPIGGGVERPIVDPHFELYKGIEGGKPEPVALEICQFSETSQVHAYIDAQNRFLEALFKPFRPTGVIRAVGMDEYKTLRDWCRGQPETQLDHTQLLQVDEFWLPSRSLSLRSQKGYLEARTWSNEGSDTIVDPHGIFQPESAGAAPTGPREQRLQFFDDGLGCPFGTEPTNPGFKLTHDVDRVPFTWDFGFLLCDVERWSSAAKQAPKTVGKVWKGLPMAWGHVDGGADSKANHKAKPRPTWREFFGACKEVADVWSKKSASRYPPFDVCLHNSESFSCLILEVWMSEILILAGKRPSECKPESVEQWSNAISIRDWAHTGCGRRLLEDPVGLPEGIAKYAFFRTWLLLADILDLDGFGSAAKPFEPVVREANPAAVASRYWYKTACAAQQKPDARVMIAAGLPGSFSVRGDWFLGVTRGSRSLRLADRALDFLSSRRANFERMQMGVGLPTRKIALDMDEDNLRVFLKGPRRPENSQPYTTHGDGQAEHKEEWPQTNVSYGSVRRLGGGDKKGGFRWLWRSAFEDYDQLNVIWQKSLVRMAIAWQAFREDLKPKPGEEPLAPFAGYDFLDDYTPESFAPEKWLERVPIGPARSYLAEATDRFAPSLEVLERLFEQAASPRPRPPSDAPPGPAVDS
jgi:hypothetical protein